MSRPEADYKLVDSARQLEEAIAVLKRADEVAIDLEFDKNRFRYGFNLCLMQLATSDEIFLIDPLAKGVDIEKVFPVLESESILKTSFEFGEDLRLLTSLGCTPKNLEDLSNASKLLGYAQLSLTNLMATVLDVELKHGAQMSNWFQRPLTGNQCAYAADDVRYLSDLRENLIHKLNEAGGDRFEWYNAENAFMLASSKYTEEDDRGLQLKKDDRADMNQVQHYVLQKLYKKRLALAKKHNRPEFKIMSMPGLLDFVRSGPDNPQVREKEVGLRSLRTEAFYESWKKLLRDSWQEAKERGLRTDESAFLPLHDDDKRKKREEQKEVNRKVEEEWKPVQAKLKKRFGQEVATFLLSNRQMKRLASGEEDIMPPYRIELFRALGGDNL